jgi:hypothetical protein
MVTDEREFYTSDVDTYNYGEINGEVKRGVTYSGRLIGSYEFDSHVAMVIGIEHSTKGRQAFELAMPVQLGKRFLNLNVQVVAGECIHDSTWTREARSLIATSDQEPGWEITYRAIGTICDIDREYRD